MEYTKEDLDGMTFYHEDDVIKKECLYRIELANDELTVHWDHPYTGSTCNYNISIISDCLKSGVWVEVSRVNKQLPIFN